MFSALLPLEWDLVFFNTGISKVNTKYLTAPLDTNSLVIINNQGHMENLSFTIFKNVTFITDDGGFIWWNGEGRGWNILHGNFDVVSAYGASGLAALRGGKLFTRSFSTETPENPNKTAWVGQEGNYLDVQGNRQGDLWMLTTDHKLVSFSHDLPDDNQTSGPVCDFTVRDKVYSIHNCHVGQLSQICSRSVNASVQDLMCLSLPGWIVPTKIAASDSNLFITDKYDRFWLTRLPLDSYSEYFFKDITSGIRFLTVPLDESSPVIINATGVIQSNFCSMDCFQPSQPAQGLVLVSISTSQNISFFSAVDRYIWWAPFINGQLGRYEEWKLVDGFAQRVSAYGTDGLAAVEAGILYTRTFSIGVSGDLVMAPWVTHESNRTFEKVEGNRQGDLWLMSGNDLLAFQPGYPLDTLTKGLVRDIAVRDKVFIMLQSQVCSRSLDITERDLLCANLDFTPYKIAASDSILYALTSDGDLFATKLPLTKDSAFFNTGFVAPYARSLSVPLDGNSPIVVDHTGDIQSGFCNRSEVSCFAAPPPRQLSPAFPLTSISISQNITYTTDIQSRIWWRVGDGTWHLMNGYGKGISAFGTSGLAVSGLYNELFTRTVSSESTGNLIMTPWSYSGGSSIMETQGNRQGNLWLRDRGYNVLRQASPGFPQEQLRGALLDFVLSDKVYYLHLIRSLWNSHFRVQICARSLDIYVTDHTCMMPFFSIKAMAASNSNLFVLTTGGVVYSTVLPFTTTSVFFDTGFRSSNATFLKIPLDENMPVILDASGNMQRDFCHADGVNCFSPPQAPAFPLTSISISQNVTYVTDSERFIWWRYGTGPWHLTNGLGLTVSAYGTTGLAVAGLPDPSKKTWILRRTLSFQSPESPDLSAWDQFIADLDVSKMVGDRHGNLWVLTRDGYVFSKNYVLSADNDDDEKRDFTNRIDSVTDFAIREQHVFYVRNHQLCVMPLDGGDVHCTLLDSTPVKIAVSDSNLFTLSENGVLFSSVLPLAWNSVFFDTGFRSPNATFLTVPLDDDFPVILDSSGNIQKDFCVESAGIHCFSSPSPPQPPPEPDVNDCAVLSSISPIVNPEEPFACCGLSEQMVLSDHSMISVKCTEDGRIDFLKFALTSGLSFASTFGSLPSRELARLDRLRHLEIYMTFDGAIPIGLGALANLVYLYRPSPSPGEYNMDRVEFGEIPQDLENLHNLEELHLTGCVGGRIPPNLGNLPRLKVLELSGKFWGDIPAELGGLSNLETMILSNDCTFRDQISGSIPMSFGHLKKLRQLHLDGHAFLAGSIPPELGALSELQEISLRCNSLTGEIPFELGNLQSLLNLNFFGNQLSGVLPDRFLESMQRRHEEDARLSIDISSNSLSGPTYDEFNYPSWFMINWNCFNSEALETCGDFNATIPTESPSAISSSTSSTTSLSSPFSRTLSSPRTSSPFVTSPIQFNPTVLPSTTQTSRLSTNASPSSSFPQASPTAPTTSIVLLSPTEKAKSSDEEFQRKLPIIAGVGSGALVFFGIASFIAGAFIGRRPQKKESPIPTDSSDTVNTSAASDQEVPRAVQPDERTAPEERRPHVNGNGHLFMTQISLPTGDHLEEEEQDDTRSDSKNSEDKKPPEPNIRKENERSSPGLASDDEDDLSLPPLQNK
ncbi:hypothetical protein HDU97_008032 [Phlyctochytrium planicorne]|nr:hypothetical protein HDU97_008032 [Phlyctochytrium planicorne]